MTSELGEPVLAEELPQIFFGLECGGDRGLVEFVDGKVRRETRYYGPPLEVDRS